MLTYNIGAELHAARHHELMAVPIGILAAIVFAVLFRLIAASGRPRWVRSLMAVTVVAVLGVGVAMAVSSEREDSRSLYITGAFLTARSALTSVAVAQALYWSDHNVYTADRAALESELDNSVPLDSTVQLQATSAHYHASVRVPIHAHPDQAIECERDDNSNPPACTILWTSGKRVKVVVGGWS